MAGLLKAENGNWQGLPERDRLLISADLFTLCQIQGDRVKSTERLNYVVESLRRLEWSEARPRWNFDPGGPVDVESGILIRHTLQPCVQWHGLKLFTRPCGLLI